MIDAGVIVVGSEVAPAICPYRAVLTVRFRLVTVAPFPDPARSLALLPVPMYIHASHTSPGPQAVAEILTGLVVVVAIRVDRSAGVTSRVPALL